MARSQRTVWSNRDFVKLWGGETVSLLGSEVSGLALPLAAVLLLSATPAQLGLLGAAKFAPFLLLSLPAGVWLDRFRKRPILLAANLGSALVLGSVPLAAASGVLSIGYLGAVAFLTGAFAVFLHVGFWSYVPSLVPQDELTAASSKLIASSSAAAVGGPGLGGVLVQLLSAPGALLFDAGSFLVAAGGLVSIRRIEPTVDDGASRRLATEIREGLAFVFGNRYLRAFAGEAATFNFFESAMMTVLLVYAIRDLQMSAGTLGAIIASGALGMLLGSLVAQRVERRLRLGRAIVWTMVLGCWPYLLVPLASRPGAASVSVLAGAFFTAGLGIGTTVVLVVAVRQSVTPDRMMGRMNASYRFVVWGFIAFGALIGGALGSSLGLRPTLVICAFGMAAAPVWILCSPIGGLRDLAQAALVGRDAQAAMSAPAKSSSTAS
jgi:MFS family permease